ncbi:MAG TPA: hypothetical protein DF613_02710 [Lachnospiraceae bacterium]|nr:hypothetical protein [Lachnospiraceae bacterium]
MAGKGPDMRERRKDFWWGALVGALAVMAVLLGVRLSSALGGGTGPESRATRNKIHAVNALIRSHYLNERDDQALSDEMLRGLVAGLDDDYAAYYTASEYEEIQNANNGEYDGIGLVMQKNGDTGEVTIVDCYEGTPAREAGIEAGDILVSADGLQAVDVELDVLAAAIKGSEGNTVHLVLMRDGETYEKDVEKARIEVHMVESRMMEDQIGYIRISQFTAHVAEDFSKAYESMLEEGMEGLVVDLRSNPGGLMDSVVDTLNVFMPEGLLVYTEDRAGERTEYSSKGESPIEIPLTVLVNGNSASASEIFAGAVKDFGVGTLVGTVTFGKGIVQKTYTMADGSAVKMTTAYYYTPKGECIHGKGIQPDVEVKPDPDSGEDVQLQRAVEICRKE